MTNQNFKVGERVFDDVLLEWGTVTRLFVDGGDVVCSFKSTEFPYMYLPDGRELGLDARPRLHKSNPAQEIFEKINEAYNKGERE